MNIKSLIFTIFTTALLSATFSFFLFQQFATAPLAQETSTYETDFKAEFDELKLAFNQQIADNKSGRLINYEASTTANDTQLNTKPNFNPPENFIATSKAVTAGVVNITAFKGSYRMSSGSGVIISEDGYILTNNHVIEDGGSFTITFNDKRELKAEIIGTDPTTDLALMKVEANDLKPLRFGDSDNVQVGEWVLAVGNPFNLASTVTAGIVSAKARNINIIGGAYSIESFIQTDAVVNPGNSGGALVNTRGDLVGVNTAILTETGSYEGYSFAIPSNLVQKVISDLREFGEVKRALLGVTIQDLSFELAEEMGLDDAKGVLITTVNPRSSAQAAGLQANDVIVKVNGVMTNSMPELQEQVARYRPGDKVSVTFFRDGKRYEKANVTLKGIDRTAGR